MRTTSYVYVVLCLLIGTVVSPQSSKGQGSFQSSSVRITTATQTSTLRSIMSDGREYLSVKELAGFFSIRYYENMVLRKAEIRLVTAVLKFTADNPFVVQTNSDTRRSTVHQLPLPVVVENGLFFVSAPEIIDLFTRLQDTSIVIGQDSALIPALPPPTPVVTGFMIEEKKNGTLLRIKMTAPVKDIGRALQSGDWVYVTLAGAEGDTTLLDTALSTGTIRRIKPVRISSALQVSIQLREKIETSEIVQDKSSSDVLVTLFPPKKPVVNTDSIRRVQEALKRREAAANQIKQQKQKWKLDVVVLDAGHGGHDPGTIGVIGTREKDITLGISLKLGKLIERYMPDVKVVYTRKTDRFVELFRRGQIANEANGKLFISIHCNSTEKKPSNANGFEIYLLRPGKTDDAIRIAEKENAVVKLEKNYEARYQELNQENFIILTMAQSAYVKQSEHFAELLEETMSADMEAQRQPVKQAGFYVLVGASMPNVLIETGYLSNPKEEKYLRSPEGQQKIAEAILKALQRFKVEYEKEID
ncbi:MAG: N-acetylmuramoyl-L-alanine amidase family protein [Bacteroidota bacterium]